LLVVHPGWLPTVKQYGKQPMFACAIKSLPGDMTINSMPNEPPEAVQQCLNRIAAAPKPAPVQLPNDPYKGLSPYERSLADELGPKIDVLLQEYQFWGRAAVSYCRNIVPNGETPTYFACLRQQTAHQ
jgi:hypothetical protein